MMNLSDTRILAREVRVLQVSFGDERPSRCRHELDPLKRSEVAEVANGQLRFGLDSLDACSSSLFRLHHVQPAPATNLNTIYTPPLYSKHTPGKRSWKLLRIALVSPLYAFCPCPGTAMSNCSEDRRF
ncbi:hypothetical protein GEV33_000149 [Tenebrio molitor]|uniref:Uncharacterized protein n=1 Tax=Tenebrio molitor TaxID=7067 RepID=A0A8J6HYP1_TENMO|nr:hypothetical protein GEV33_000149 [Tenebrio molitor]